MAITVQPVDGLIHRLLQQNSKTEPPLRAGGGPSAPQDHVSISSQARSQAQPVTQDHVPGKGQAHTPSPQNSGEGRGRALESHLLELYRTHDGYGG